MILLTLRGYLLTPKMTCADFNSGSLALSRLYKATLSNPLPRKGIETFVPFQEVQICKESFQTLFPARGLKPFK